MNNPLWGDNENNNFQRGERCVAAQNVDGDWRLFSENCEANFRSLCVGNARASCKFILITIAIYCE